MFNLLNKLDQEKKNSENRFIVQEYSVYLQISVSQINFLFFCFRHSQPCPHFTAGIIRVVRQTMSSCDTSNMSAGDKSRYEKSVLNVEQTF